MASILHYNSRTFNQTKMELKPEFPSKKRLTHIPFNQTKMELKQTIDINVADPISSF